MKFTFSSIFYDADIDKGGSPEVKETRFEQMQRETKKVDKEAQDNLIDHMEGISEFPVTRSLEDEPKKEEEEAVEEEVVDEEEETEEEVAEGEEEEEETTEEEESEEEEEEEDEDPLMAELGKLTKQLADYDDIKEQTNTQEEATEEEVEVEEKKKPTPEVKGIKEYVTKDMFKDTLDDEERTTFNQILTQMRNELIKDAREATMKDGLDIFPNMINFRLQGYIAANEFWANNPDLEAFVQDNEKYNAKKFVMKKATEIQRANPEFNLAQVYEKTNKEVRGLFGNRIDKYKDAGADSKVRRGKKPALPKKPSHARKPVSTKGKKKLTQEEAAFLDLL